MGCVMGFTEVKTLRERVDAEDHEGREWRVGL